VKTQNNPRRDIPKTLINSNEIVEIDQESKILEVISLNCKNNNVCTILISLWNCRSFTYEKKSLMNSRDDDIIILNETWDNKLNVSGYNQLSNIRTCQRGGGVAILTKEHFETKLIDDSIKDTLAVKVYFGRNKYLLIITSYFPCSNQLDLWGKRWRDLIEMIGKYSTSKDNMNILIGCDFNRDITEDHNLVTQLEILNLKIIENRLGATYEINQKK